MSRKCVMLSIATMVAALGCGADQEVSSVGPQSPHPVPAGLIEGSFVQAGTVFSARVDDAIDTLYSAPGTRFTATVTSPMTAQDGRVIVPYGAKVRGTLASVGAEERPLIRVQLDTIDTVDGTLPLHAAVRAAQHYDWKGPPTPEPSASYVFSYGFTDYGSDTAGSTLPGRPAEGRALMQPREVHVPAGAQMQLQLTEALVMPGAQLTR